VSGGGVVVFDDTVDMAQQARFAMEFCAPGPAANAPPVGSARGVEIIDRVIAGQDRERNLRVLRTFCADGRWVALCHGVDAVSVPSA
jgi:formate dehydrogenase iron-sulfur subunit